MWTVDIGANGVRDGGEGIIGMYNGRGGLVPSAICAYASWPVAKSGKTDHYLLIRKIVILTS